MKTGSKNTPKISTWTGEIILNIVAIAVTIVVAVMVGFDTRHTFGIFLDSGKTSDLFEFTLFSTILFVLMYGSMVYLFARLYYFIRLRRMAQSPISAAPMNENQRLTVLIPSYREEKAVVWRTLVSAAMIEHPNRRAVLLVDDPPNPRRRDDMESLASARILAGDVHELFAPVSGRIAKEVSDLRPDAPADERRELAVRLYEMSALFLERLANDVSADVYGGPADHTRSFFVEKILRDPAMEYRERARALREGDLADDLIAGELNRLTYLFKTRVEFFERKLYVNMPKAADKATNLNAYLSLIGRCFIKQEREDGTHIIEVDEAVRNPRFETLKVEDTDYVLVLDADSIVFPRYAKTLLGIMEAPGGEKIGVAQTPYLTFPGATSLLERIAGATTDIQFIIHQGMGALGAGFWVGANALVRMKAFREIAEPAEENGHPFFKFIQDRTVIEDTGSSIDLRIRGWEIHNHAEGLAYSATPPDFGSLLIQRRRWANGGLILIPDLLRYLRKASFGRGLIAEAFMRFHYLASQGFVSVGVLALLLYPFDDRFASNLLPLTAVPYFILYGRDLKRIGYAWFDLPRIYSLNLMLLPVILGGVAKSIHQIVSSKKTPFARTPKVEGRTSTPAGYLLMEVGLLLWMFLIFWHDIVRDDREHAFFALSSALAFLYGCVAIVGMKPLAEDIALGVTMPVVNTAKSMFASERPLRQRVAYGASVAAVGILAVVGTGMTLWA